MAPKDFKYETYRKSTDLIKARFNKLEETVSKITATPGPLSPVELRKLNTVFSELKKKHADFELNVNRIIESEAEEATESVLSSDIDAINDLYVKISSMIEVTIAAETPATPGSLNDSGVTQPFPTAIVSGVKLPKLDLQTFDGSPLKWISFINLFDITVHKNTTISNVAKFQYLLSILSGEPLNLVKSLSLTAPNYGIAYNLLRERYHNIRRLSTLHLHALMDMPSLTTNNPKHMRSFITTFYEHSESLKALDCEVTQNNPFLAAYLLRKLDNKTVQKLEQYRSNQGENHEAHSLPQITEIIKFLNLECSHIEDAQLHSASLPVKSKNDDQKKPHSSRAVTMNVSERQAPPSKDTCFCCQKPGHKIYSCADFKTKSPSERYNLAKQNQRCISCLGNHLVNDCRSQATCLTCHKKHHTMLHFSKTPQQKTSAPKEMPEANLHCTSKKLVSKNTTVLLGTTLVKLTASNGRSHVFRALLDSGSTSDFLSEHAAQILGTKRLPSNITVMGLAQTPAHTRGQLSLDVGSLSGHTIAKKHPFHILEKISVDLPRVELTPEVISRVKPYPLADPTFNKPGPIDVLLGCALFPQVLTNERHSLGSNMPYALGTIFGYIIVGSAPCISSTSGVNNHVAISLLSTDTDLHTSLQRFWTQEELPQCSQKTTEEIQCDEFFATTHTRNGIGRYVLRLPFKPNGSYLGLSRQTAEQRFHSLEKKLQVPQNKELQSLYTGFMQEYHSLGHMTPCTDLNDSEPHYFLPHHGVFKVHSSTPSIRVVFDASAKTSSGLSLNDVLMTGSKLQNDICDILVQFRLQNVVFSCDIRQMYRQIDIHPEDRKYQLILWRDNPSLPMSVYQLTTVTYGMNCSPYLAIKTLQQLAMDEGARFPLAAKILLHNSYVDDIIAGASSVEEAAMLQGQLIDLLKLGGFELRKWVSNAPELLQNLPTSHQETPVFLQSSNDPHFSILGLKWSPASDSFKYVANFNCDAPTKRKVLSLVAQIYDPCGFLAPCIMTAKCFMQLLWTSGNTWDEPLSAELTLKWHSFVSDLKNIVDINIPRAISLPTPNNCEIHGFSDASESGYAAVVYVRSCNSSEVHVTQLIAKTRVAPLKKVTLPRLELCAAHLLAQLVHYCLSQLSTVLKIESITLWCDSTVTLSWLQTAPYRLKTYVANRVAQTQELISPQCWRHIPSSDNPADCASRGILPSQLVNHPLWWHGPAWLQLPPSNWPTSGFVPINTDDLAEVKSTPLHVLLVTPPHQWEILQRFSTWTKLLHVMAYVLRFVRHSRRQASYVGPLTVPEVRAAQLCIFRLVQQESFSEELHSLRRNQSCSTRLQRLTPFIDEDGLLRAGGRLKHADLQQDIRHPCILPKKHHVVNLFIDFLHIHHLHSGAQLTLAMLAQHAWVLSARSVVRSRIFQCLKCFKNKPRNTFPLMGDLPKPRITPARPFASSGIDYGGPFLIKVHNLRSVRHVKAYICVFVCFVTKAVHIEVATDLSSDSFIAALTRFVSRRGLCSDIFSDCATNFVGAKNELRKLIHSCARPQIELFALRQHINFHFNPPAAPHQGGLWESAIKSAKFHLKRVLGTHVPTLSQFMTLTCRVEAMLNSRPLTALSSDPNDLQALTPGHFLIGAPLAAVPEPRLADLPDNRLSQWQLYQALMQRIWTRWSQEYLHTLQQRLKWKTPTRNLQVGDLVLLQQDTPPLVWPLARVTKVTTGQDDQVRVVELKTQQGVFTRPAVKVFLLPFLST